MVKLLVNYKRLSIAECWAEVSYKLYRQILTEWEPEKKLYERDRVKLFSILTGKPYAAIVQSSDFVLEGALYECTGFVYDEDLTAAKKELPKALRVGDCLIDIPTNIGRMTIAQNLHVIQMLKGVADERLLYAKIVSIYLQPLLDGKTINGKTTKAEFDFTRAMEIEPLIGELMITEIYPLAFFLLSQLPGSGMLWFNLFVLKILRRIRNIRL